MGLLTMQHRRERINERLKVLQKLVPNGAKVSPHFDIHRTLRIMK
jgi:hypothetical protein